MNHLEPMPPTLPKLLSTSILSELRAYDVADSKIIHGDDSPLSLLAARSIATGMAELLPAPPEGDAESHIGSAISIPVYRAGQAVSVVVLAIRPQSEGAGVFEIWEPIGPYEELKLRAGYYAHLERFSNVSSFVRFEYGSGLPGQVWSEKRSVIHDNLPDHSGFLRAAGASAGLLQTALAIPICDAELASVAVLISSKATPIAKGYEVWKAEENEFRLCSVAYQGVSEDGRLEMDTTIPTAFGLPGLAREHQGASTTQNDLILRAGRKSASEFIGGLAIPFYESEELASVTTLLF